MGHPTAPCGERVRAHGASCGGCARRCLRAGVDVLIEKPLAATLAEADAIVALAEQHGRRGAGRASGAVQSGGAARARHAEPADVL